MPIVRVEMWPGRTTEQKARLARAITDAMKDIIGAPPDATTVVFTEISRDNWAEAGVLKSMDSH